MGCSPPASSIHGISQARILECIAILSLLQGIFLTQGSNPGLLHCRQFLYCLSYQGNLLKHKTVLFKTTRCLLILTELPTCAYKTDQETAKALCKTLHKCLMGTSSIRWWFMCMICHSGDFFLKVYKQLEYKQQMTGSEKRIAVGRILMETLKTSHRRWHLSWGMQAEYTSAVTYL